MAIQTPAPSHALPQVTTAEELLALSQDDSRRYELIEGELVAMSPTGAEHGILAARLLAALQSYVDAHNCGVVFAAETGFRLTTNPDTVRAADVSFIRQERATPERISTSYVPGAPDLAVEVLSPTDSASAVQQKVQMWLAHGTALVWVVEPRTQTITIYRRDGSINLLKRGEVLEGGDVLPGFAYPLDRLFR